MTVGVAQLRVRYTRGNPNSVTRNLQQMFLLRTMTDHQQLLTQVIAGLHGLVHILIGQQTRDNQEVIIPTHELFQARNRFRRGLRIHRVRREEDRNVLLTVYVLDALLNDAGIRHVNRRAVRRPVIPQHQRRTQRLQQQRNRAGALLTQVLITQVEPTGRRVAVDKLTSRIVEAVRPTRRRHNGTLRGNLQQGGSQRKNRQSHAVVTAQVANLVQRTRDDFRILELGERSLRIVQGRVNRSIWERTMHSQDHALSTATLGQVVVRNRHLFLRLRPHKWYVTAHQTRYLLYALRNIPQNRVWVLRPGKRSGGQELSERHFLFPPKKLSEHARGSEYRHRTQPQPAEPPASQLP